MSDNLVNYFDKMAADWDTPQSLIRSDALSLIAREFIKGNENIILDFGCGTGQLSWKLRDLSQSLIGIDNSKEMIHIFDQRFKDHQSTSYVLNIEQDELPSDIDPYNIIVSSMAFHHLRNPERVLQKLKSKLIEGGYILIFDLDKEDGSFHQDPKAMGVFHSGFSLEERKQWAQLAGLNHILTKDAYEINKNNQTYKVCLSVFTN